MSSQVPGKSKTQNLIYRILHKVLPASALRWLVACVEPHSPTVPGLTENDKAKVDYEHNMKLREIGLDKGCFTVLAGFAAAGAILLSNYLLESYRSADSRERALTEKRVEALTAIASAHSRMTRAFFRYSHEEPETPPEKATKEYSEAIDNLMHEINKHLVLLGVDFDKDTSWYIVLHRYFRDIGVTKGDKYGTLASNLDNEFNSFCEEYLKEGKYPEKHRMVVRPSSREERLGMKPEDYITAMVVYRKQHGKDDKLDENLNEKKR